LKEVRELVIPISEKNIPDRGKSWLVKGIQSKIMPGVFEESQQGSQCGWSRMSKKGGRE